MPTRPTQISLEPERQRALAADLFNYVWTWMESEDRTQRQTDLMVAAAYASRFFWEDEGEPLHHARGEWQISRACAIAGRPAEAREHAERCLQLCEDHELSPFDFGYAHEALARAHHLAGDDAAARKEIRAARRIAPRIEDSEDREYLIGDLEALGLS
jgi:tetratricopeptide (TPR) repeat protein